MIDHHDWRAAPELPALADGEVHVWLARVASLGEPARGGGGPRSAQARSERVRGVLRALLGGYLGAPPGELRFAYGAQGKPALEGANDAGGIRFNVSHAGELALLAFAAGREVGVDVERVREVPRAERIAERVLSAEAAQGWRALPPGEREEAFIRAWTGLEAMAKLSGEGVWRTLRSRAHEASGAACSRYELRPGPGYLGALAVAGEGVRVRAWRYQDGLLSSSASSSSGGSGGAK